MKVVHGREAEEKSWGVQLKAHDKGYVSLDCVDTLTGAKITDILAFHPDGDVVISGGVDASLLDNGYDPYEHGNRYTEEGYLVVGWEWKVPHIED